MAEEQIALDDLMLTDGELFHDRKGAVCDWPRPLAPLADTHGHLTSFRAHDPAMALVRAALAGVRLLVIPVDPVSDVPRKWESVSAFNSWLEGQRSPQVGERERVQLLARGADRPRPRVSARGPRDGPHAARLRGL